MIPGAALIWVKKYGVGSASDYGRSSHPWFGQPFHRDLCSDALFSGVGGRRATSESRVRSYGRRIRASVKAGTDALIEILDTEE